MILRSTYQNSKNRCRSKEMNMNSNMIESLAGNAVEDYFIKIERINPTIPVGDKEPSWDGFLYLYPDD